MRCLRKYDNQKGFSLVELVVVMAILSILMIGIYSFFHTSTKAYSNNGAEVDLQSEAQLTQNQLDNLIIDSTQKLKYSYDTASATDKSILSDAEIGSDVVEKKHFIVDNGNEIYCLEWDTATSEINFFRTTIKADGTGETSSPSLLAEYVQSFDVNLNRVKKQRVVEFHFVYEKAGKTFEARHNITMRNRVAVNEPDSGKDVPMPFYVDHVDIFEDKKDGKFLAENKKTNVSTQMQLGTSIDLIAKIFGINSPSQDVTWMIIGEATDSDTKITTTGNNTCTFKIGASEKNKVFKVRATSVADTTKYAEATFTLPGSGRIPGGKGFVRGGPGYVMDLETLGVDMSQVSSVEWGFSEVMIVEQDGKVHWMVRNGKYDSTYFHVPKNQIWKPLEEGESASDLVYYYSENNRDNDKMITLTQDLNNIGQCCITAGKDWSQEGLIGNEGFQAVVTAKITYKDGRVESKTFGNILDDHPSNQVINNPLFLDCIFVELIKPDGGQFFNWASYPQGTNKVNGSSMSTLQIADDYCLKFRVEMHGYYEEAEFVCKKTNNTDENSKKENEENENLAKQLFEVCSYDKATGDVIIKPRAGARGTVYFKVELPKQGFSYTVPVQVADYTYLSWN